MAVEVTVDIKDIFGDTDNRDKVRAWSPGIREAGDGLINSRPQTKQLVNGKATLTLEPGPVTVQFLPIGAAGKTKFEGVVPDTGPVTLRSVIEGDFTYTPPVVQAGVQAIWTARDKSLAVVEDAVEDLDTDVTEFKTKADNALTVAQTADGKSTIALSKATGAETKANNIDTRMEGIESMAGLGPSTPVDGQQANLISQPDSLTRQQLDNLYAPVMMFFPRLETDLDDTERLQRAVDYCASEGLPLSLEGDPYSQGLYWVRQVNIPSTLEMVDLAGATLKRPNLKIAPYNLTVAQRKWVRMLSITHTGSEDSKTVTVRNGTLDGNCWENWEDPTTPSYEQEQASLIISSGDKTTGGKLVLTVENVRTRDNTSDGLHLVTEVSAIVNNLHSRDCYRGGLVMTGGGTTITASNLLLESTRQDMPDGIDLEVDSTGFEGRKDFNATLTNVVIDRDLDVSVPVGGSAVLDNIVMRKGQWNLQSSGDLRVSNSVLIQRAGSGGLFRGLNTFRASFSNVQFLVSDDSGIVFPTGFPYTPSGIVDFTACSFVGGAMSVAGNGGSGVDMQFNACSFAGEGNAIGKTPSQEAPLGLKRLTLNGCRFDNPGLVLSLSPSTGRSFLDVGTVQVTNPQNRGLQIGNVDVTWLGNPVFQYGIQIGVASATTQSYVGNRTVVVDADPNDATTYGSSRVSGTEGDTAIMRGTPQGAMVRNPRTWRYAQFPNVAGFYYHIWEEVLRGRKVSITSRRPPSPVVSNEPFFDTTLGKPIWWNGSAWVDASGVVV